MRLIGLLAAIAVVLGAGSATPATTSTDAFDLAEARRDQAHVFDYNWTVNMSWSACGEGACTVRVRGAEPMRVERNGHHASIDDFQQLNAPMEVADLFALIRSTGPAARTISM